MRSLWQIQQGRKCTCEGSDEYCPCQNVQFVDRNTDDGEGPTRFTQEPQPGQLLDWMTHHHIPMGLQRTEDDLWELFDQSQDTVIASAGDVYDVLKIAYENENQQRNAMRIHKFPDAPPTARQHCRHYKYVRDPNDFKNSGPTCKIGKMVDAPGRAFPCLPDGTGCRFREEWTDEERAAWKDWSDASIKRSLALLNAIPDDGEKGEIDCPNCEGPADWVRAFNGHIHARCRTPNCSAFMQ